MVESQRLHDWERVATRHAVLQQRLGGAELGTPVEKAVAGHSDGEGRWEASWRERRAEARGGEGGVVERRRAGGAVERSRRLEAAVKQPLQ